MRTTSNATVDCDITLPAMASQPHQTTTKPLTSKKMKLNLRPNNQCELATKSRVMISAKLATSLSLLYTVFIHIALVRCSSSLQLANTIRNHNQNSTSPSRDVTNLHLTSDFRAVKLRWSYEHTDKNRPASFDVRFCELTSWNIEIKCRSRELQVEHGPPASAKSTPPGHKHPQLVQEAQGPRNKQSDSNSVIGTPQAPLLDTVHQLEPPSGPAYEAQIYDLRALTNYTFQVQVARFEHEPPQQQHQPLPIDGTARTGKRSRGQSARRLSQEAADQHLVRRIETKPFGAEATKCLADVSEVLINTGRYFGGRISVEDSNDPRCQLVGNKSSEQSTYLFRIDHEICSSKTVDGNRIETMVLVHENKDILTHNTARFLVLCNFLQRSFTLRASVSLPKVNGVVASRPAVITSLPRYSNDEANQADSSSGASDSRVMLGSMPGIYRARVPHANIAPEQSNLSADPASAKRPKTTTPAAENLLRREEDSNAGFSSSGPETTTASGQLKPAVNNRQPLDELDGNTIERKFVDKDSRQPQRLLALGEGQAASSPAVVVAVATPSAARQSKELGLAFRRDASGLESSRARERMLLAPESAASLQPAETSGKLFVPQPVQVQSKVLYIERAAMVPVRTGKLHRPVEQQQQQQPAQSRQHTTIDSLVVEPNSSQIDTPAPRMPTTSALSPITSSLAGNSSPQPPPAAIEAADREPKQLSVPSDELADLQAYPPIIITNNHRVAGDYPPMAQLAARAAGSRALAGAAAASDNNSAAGAAQANNFTIKYSANRVDDFPVENQLAPFVELGGRQGSMMMMRPRSGRMRSIMSADESNRSTGGPNLRQSPMTTLAPIDLGGLLDLRQPTWGVNRMGESTTTTTADGIGGDLVAETSNETMSQVTVANSTSLAQNITGALLRWSLKTLTNLARKSLESLISDHNNSSATGELDYSTLANQTVARANVIVAPDVPQQRWLTTQNLPEVPLRTTQGPTRQPAASSSSRPPTSSSSSSSPSVAITTTTRRGSVVTPPGRTTSEQVNSETKSSTVASNDEVLADGFITSASKQVNHEAGHAKHSHVVGHHTRSNNYSKSLDLNHAAESTLRHKTNTSEKNAPTIKPVGNGSSQPTGNRQSSRLGSENQTPHFNESVWNSRESFYSSWAFYGLLMFVALITAIFLTMCLVSVTQSRRKTRSTLDCGPETARGIRPLGFNCDSSSIPELLDSSSNQALVHGATTTYQKYDYNKFENYPTMNNKRGLLADREALTGRLNQWSPSEVSHTTRSTSANSTLLADENDYKNSEFLYTEHVLINTGSSIGGESYA